MIFSFFPKISGCDNTLFGIHIKLNKRIIAEYNSDKEVDTIPDGNFKTTIISEIYKGQWFHMHHKYMKDIKVHKNIEILL